MSSGEKIIQDRDLRPVAAGVDSTDITQVINLRLNPSTKRLLVDSVQATALPTEGSNPSITLTKVTIGAETTTTIQKIIGLTTYTKTIVKNTDTGITTVSEWT